MLTIGVDVVAHSHGIIARAGVVFENHLLGLVKPVAGTTVHNRVVGDQTPPSRGEHTVGVNEGVEIRANVGAVRAQVARVHSVGLEYRARHPDITIGYDKIFAVHRDCGVPATTTKHPRDTSPAVRAGWV